MKIFLTLLLSTASPGFAAEVAAPPWLEKSTTRQGSIVSEYLLRGKRVYVMGARCCDIPAEVFDQRGKRVCALRGGIANVMDKKCARFYKEAKFLRNIGHGPKAPELKGLLPNE